MNVFGIVSLFGMSFIQPFYLFIYLFFLHSIVPLNYYLFVCTTCLFISLSVCFICVCLFGQHIIQWVTHEKLVHIFFVQSYRLFIYLFNAASQSRVCKHNYSLFCIYISRDQCGMSKQQRDGLDISWCRKDCTPRQPSEVSICTLICIIGRRKYKYTTRQPLNQSQPNFCYLILAKNTKSAIKLLQ